MFECTYYQALTVPNLFQFVQTTPMKGGENPILLGVGWGGGGG